VELITSRDMIRNVLSKWTEQYPPGGEFTDVGKLEITQQLTMLDLEIATGEDVANIIGNKSWTHLRCHECDKRVSLIIQMGEPLDYESRTASLCVDCVTAAYNFFQEHLRANPIPSSATCT